jgi:hypothetical protein
MAVKMPTKAVMPMPMIKAVKVALNGLAFMEPKASERLIRLNIKRRPINKNQS